MGKFESDPLFGARRTSFGRYAAVYDAVRPECVARMLGSPDESIETELFRYGMRQSVDDLVLHASSWSYVAIHPERDRVLDEVLALGRKVAGGDGMVQIPMTTRCYRLRRR